MRGFFKCFEKKKLSRLIKKLTEEHRNIVTATQKRNLSIEKILECITQYYENIIDCMPGNVYWLDKNATAVGCNRNVLDMFGFKFLSEFRGLSFEEMGERGGWTLAAVKKFKQDTLDVIKSGQAKLNEEEPPIPHSDGRKICFLTSRVPLYDDTGAVIGVVGISIDITERKQMEENLQRAKEAAETAHKAKSEFLANISHDIKTPIVGLIGTSEYLAHALKDTEYGSRAESIVQSSTYLLNMMSELIEVARLSEPSEKIHESIRFKLKTIISEVMGLIKPAADYKGLEFNIEYKGQIPNVLIGNRTYLYRILLNLISNAVKFTDTGNITIQVELVEETEKKAVIKLLVKDSGIGIPKDKQSIIFERFTRLSPSYQGIYRGTGLGLSIVKEFVETMGGEVYVESEEGKGSTFICVMPFKKSLVQEDTSLDEYDLSQLQEAKAFSQQVLKIFPIKREEEKIYQAINQTDSQNAVRILIVEDDLISARAVRDTLVSLGCYVDIAYTGHSALDFYKNNKYHLVYMDLGLPDIDGREVTKEIRKIEEAREQKTPIFALSAHVDKDITTSCFECGMDDVLAKPLLRSQAEKILNAIDFENNGRIPKDKKQRGKTYNSWHVSGK